MLVPPETLAEAYERALEEEALLQEIEEKPRCPGCSRVTEQNWLLCPYCHTRLKKACGDCNTLLELTWNLCPYCGNQEIDPYRADSPASAMVTLESDTQPAGETEQSPTAPTISAADGADSHL